ncbi:MAG: BatA domain-containing protein [Verrucomicrobiales bacterium]|nr:BatA domain-containing protein [Verrucomicrobiales bacterium]
MLEFLLNPGFLFAGTAAVAAPIIIHLLNRRRFKRIDWAAMDFLLEAQRLNRRRVKLEELILLLLRCLAMILIGLMIARPSLDINVSGILKSGQTERVIVLDDSLSMATVGKSGSSIDKASEILQKGIKSLSNINSQDIISVVRTTDPNKFSPNGLPLTESSIGELLDEFKGLEVTDSRGELPSALSAVEKSFDSDKTNFNKVVYVLTDLRRMDWESSTKSGSDKGIVQTLQSIADKAAGCYVVDLGSEVENNLLIEEVKPLDKVLVNGVAADFEVLVRNLGKSDVDDVNVSFSVRGSLPIKSKIPQIQAGGVGVATFSYTFTDPGRELFSAPVEISLDDELSKNQDALIEDNTRYFPARVANGIRVLIVDGDPSGIFGKSESFYLSKALSPGGPAISGVDVTVLDDTDFDSSNLSEYEVIFVANLYRITEARAEGLHEWVQNGGGLILLLGDQIDEDVYNDVLYKNGTGLLPFKLSTVGGDEKEEKWVYIKPEKENHPLFRFFEGDNRQLLDQVKVFRWWNSELEENEDSISPPNVIASLTSDDNSPAIVERQTGKGRVLAITTPLDNDWNNFPENGASFLITAQELVRYMSKDMASEGMISVAEPIIFPVDVREYRQQAKLLRPGENDFERVEALPQNKNNLKDLEWTLGYEKTDKKGIYEIQFERADGSGVHSLAFAANIDTGESDLRRISVAAIRSDLGAANVEFLPFGSPVLEQEADVVRSEMWKVILIVLGVLLLVELFYGWWIGARR